MGGDLKIGKDTAWLPRSVIFDTALEHIAQELNQQNPVLASIVTAPIGEVPFLDVSMLGAEEFEQVGNAVSRVVEKQLLYLRTNSTNINRHVIRWVYDLCELKALFRLDTRTKDENSTSTCSLIFSSEAIWQVHGWLYDFVLEGFGVEMLQIDTQIAQVLLDSRTIGGVTQCHLSNLGFEGIKKLKDGILPLEQLYAIGRASVGVSPIFESSLYTKIGELAVLLRGSDTLNNA
jgi:hypothetical protein